MAKTVAGYSFSERQQLIDHDSESASGGDGDGEAMAPLSGRSFLGPIAVIAAIPIIWVIFTGFVVVPPGELAVIVTLGHVDVYEPGPHFRTPFVSTVHTMTTKTQLLSERNNIPTKEGLSVSLDVAL